MGCLAVLGVGAGCGSSSSSPDGPITIGDDNNYTSTASLNLPEVETAPNVDLDICWPNLVSDLQCHDVDPLTDIDNVAMLRLSHLSNEEIEAELTSGQLTQSTVAGYVAYQPLHTSTCAKLTQFSFFGTEVDVVGQLQESADERFVLVFTKGTMTGVGARAMTFVKPTSTSTNTRVDAPAGCGLLDFSADLTSITPLAMPAAGPWVMDWGAVTRDSQGNPVIFQTIDSVIIGFYEGMTATDIQPRIFDLEQIATTLWDLPLPGGRTADLAMATERGAGTAFPGFTRTDGTWLLALMCRTCQNPAPVVLTILEPSNGEAQ